MIFFDVSAYVSSESGSIRSNEIIEIWRADAESGDWGESDRV